LNYKQKSQVLNFAMPKNMILASLPGEDYKRLLPNFETVALVPGTTLYNVSEPIRYAYFPNVGFVSQIFPSEDGTTVEVGMIGNEGMVGISSLFGENTFPHQTIVSSSGNAIKIRMDIIKSEFYRTGFLHSLLLKYFQSVLTQLNLLAVCNCFHTVKTRLCCWLLRAQDRTKSDTLKLTQEYLSYMIGTSRSEVAIFAKILQRDGLINYKRGKIIILDRVGLENVACECYKIGKIEFDMLSHNYLKVTNNHNGLRQHA
jgi:CRP-like cAMP-binding protein